MNTKTFQQILIECEAKCGNSGIFKVSFILIIFLQVCGPEGWEPKSESYDSVQFNVKSKVYHFVCI